VRGVCVLDGCQGSACRRTAGRFLDEILIVVYRGWAFEIEGSQSLWPLTLKMLTVDDRVDVYYFAATKRLLVVIVPTELYTSSRVETQLFEMLFYHTHSVHRQSRVNLGNLSILIEKVE
jgi:hypothetical protein